MSLLSRSGKPSLFLERLILFLMPFFSGMTPDRQLVRAEIIETLESYGARTRAEFLAAAKIIAFGMSALDILAESKATEDMPLPLRLRFRNCANGLDRACRQNEKALAKQLACDAPDAIAEMDDLINDLPQDVAEDMLQQARAAIESYRNRLSSPGPDTTPRAGQAVRPERNKVWTGAMMDALVAETGRQLQPGSAA